jgi:hypothetical protein
MFSIEHKIVCGWFRFKNPVLFKKVAVDNFFGFDKADF